MGVLKWGIVLATLALGLWMGMVVMPVIQAGAGGLPPFDTRVAGYGLADAQAFLAVLTPEARTEYLGPFRWADTAFPILWAITLMLPLSGRGVVAYVPAAIYGLSDLAEDWMVAKILTAGPDLSAGTVTTASALTMVKFAAMAVAAVLAVAALWQAWRRTH